MIEILSHYQKSFANKIHVDNASSSDVLMDAFGITHADKDANRQYWGRELGACWEKLVIHAFENLTGFQEGLTHGAERPCDLRFNKFAIDTKYRVGSGDSGTLKKFAEHGLWIKEQGYTPVILALRDDNLPAALNAFHKGGWVVHTASDAFDFIKTHTHVDLNAALIANKGRFAFNK